MNILDNLTPFEKSVYEILNDKHVGYITGRYSTHATTKYEIMTSLKVMYKLPQKDDRLIRKAISSMRQKGINGYGATVRLRHSKRPGNAHTAVGTTKQG